MIERITHCIRHCLSPFLKLCISVCLACDEFLRHSVATHRSPLVMVTSEPDLCKVCKLIVVCYHLRYKMAVIVYDRLILRTLMIKLTRIIVGEHEVVVDKGHIPRVFNIDANLINVLQICAHTQ